MWNYATINLVNELARLPGVGNVTVMGAGEYSMRIWMDPQKLYSYGLAAEGRDPTPIREQSQEVAAGQVGMPPAPKDQQFQYTVDIQSRLERPGSSATSSSRTRPPRAAAWSSSRTSARIELGAQTYSQDFKLDGKPAAGIAIYQTPDANSLQVANEVAAEDGGAVAPLPARPALQHPLQHDDLRQGLDQRGLQDPVAGRACWC